MHDLLAELWQSTANLHKRFYGEDYPTFEAQYRVFFEELAEFTQTINEPYEIADMQATHEAADVIVTLLGLLQGHEFLFVNLASAIESTIAKNDAKTIETHFVRPDGKIARRKEAVQD